MLESFKSLRTWWASSLSSESTRKCHRSSIRTLISEISKEWLLANICPLFQLGWVWLSLVIVALCPSHVCRVSCLNIYIVCSNISARLEDYQLLSDRQYTIRKKHSCETQLTTVIYDWVKVLDEGQDDTFILDFEKLLEDLHTDQRNMFLPLLKLRARVGIL